MRSLHPRHRIDIGPEDLAFGLDRCARRIEPTVGAIDSQLDDPSQWIVTLSVRSAFDLLLTSLALEPGAEVLLSALTIPDMAKVVTAHGLVPVPVDIDPLTLSVTRDTLEHAWSPRARALVVAQLFGAAGDLDEARGFCAARGLLLVNDNAQGYTGPESLLEQPGDVVFFSFGSIKTATCLGGALTRVRNAGLGSRMKREHARWPLQSPRGYSRKLAQYAALLVPRNPSVYGLFEALCERMGPGLDGVVMSMTRGFPSASVEELLTRLRQRPCGALVALLARRLRAFDGRRVHQRAQAGASAVDRLSPEIEVLGVEQRRRTHWLFAVSLEHPERYVAPLRAAGFDSARGTTSITALGAPRQRPETHPAAAHRIMERLLFLPMYPEIPAEDRERLTRVMATLTRSVPR